MDSNKEQQGSGDELPTYDTLAAAEASNPNSRFGRWRDWVEKRALERYASQDTQVRHQRRMRGWGNSSPISSPEESAGFQFGEERLNISSPSLSAPVPSTSPRPPARISVGHRIATGHASVHNFGSRFIPHSTSPIHTILPILQDRFLLIGTDDGLSVLDLFPRYQRGGFGGSSSSDLGDATAKTLWKGDPIYQLSLLEVSSSTPTGTPQGVVLALVGSEPGSLENGRKSVRMYSLASLCSLVTYIVNQAESSTVDLARPVGWKPKSSPLRRHRATNSLTKGLLSLVIDHSNSHSSPSKEKAAQPEHPTSVTSSRPRLNSYPSVSGESSWDVVDEMPLKWATDFVPLAPPNSRVSTLDVARFELFRSEGFHGRAGSTVLAVAAKSSILVYEASRGERAFRFIQELYTPFPVSDLKYVYQANLEARISRHSYQPSLARHSIPDGADLRSHSMRVSRDRPSSISIFGAQLSLFVTFEKRAAIIRLADSTVQEVSLYEEKSAPSPSDPSSTRQRATSFENAGHVNSGLWLPVASIRLPPTPQPLYAPEIPTLETVYILTKGKRSHIIPSPLPTPISESKPLMGISWHSQPTGITVRTCIPSLDNPKDIHLQLVGFGPAGIEVIEVPITLLRARAGRRTGNSSSREGKGKGKALPEPPTPDLVRASVDVGADTSFLSVGGLWHERKVSERPLVRRRSSASSIASSVVEMRDRDPSGIYACARKGAADYRVFFVGDFVQGDSQDDPE